MSGPIWVLTVCERYQQWKKSSMAGKVLIKKYSLYIIVFAFLLFCRFCWCFFFLFTKMKILKLRYNLQASSMMINLRKHLVWLEWFCDTFTVFYLFTESGKCFIAAYLSYCPIKADLFSCSVWLISTVSPWFHSTELKISRGFFPLCQARILWLNPEDFLDELF